MKRCLLVAMVVFAVVGMVAGPVLAADNVAARLRGFEEVPVISTTGQGVFLGAVNDAGTELTYTLAYFGMESNVTQAHIHLGQTGVNGGIVLFLCTNLAPPAGVPAPPACPNGVGFQVVSGSLTSANVIAQAAQGVAAGEFADVIRAIIAGVAYANIHTTGFPGGETRGQITR